MLELAAIGDSKTHGQTCCIPEGGFRRPLRDLLLASGNGWSIVEFGSNDSYWYGEDGQTVADIDGAMDAWLASRPVQKLPAHVLVNAGTNDLSSGTTEAAYKASLGSLLDKLHATWPDAAVRAMRPWIRGKDAQSVAMAGWIATVVSTRAAWAFVGPDEYVFLRGSDDGATMTSDGSHPNVLGYAETGAQWLPSMGY